MLPKVSDRPPWPGPGSHRPTLDTSILLMENSAQGVEDPPAGDKVSSALWLAQGTIKPIRLPLATPKVQAVKQGVQRKTSNQSYYPSHPPLPTWGTLEMSEHTRGRSSTWSVTTVIKKALLHLSHQETATKNTECWTSVLHSHCHHPLLQVMCSQTEPASSRGVRTEPLHRA